MLTSQERSNLLQAAESVRQEQVTVVHGRPWQNNVQESWARDAVIRVWNAGSRP